MRTYDLEAEEHLEVLATFLEFQLIELTKKLVDRSCTNSAAAIASDMDRLIRELRKRAELIARPD